MPTYDERARHVTQKLERAKEHMAALKQEAERYLGSSPYRVAVRRAPDTRKLVYYVDDVTPVPDRLSLIAGDAIQNLVSCLDHLAYQLVCRDCADKPPNPRGIYFPIADDAAGYHKKKTSQMQGAGAGTLAAIDGVAPYKGGNDSLWTLYRLNIIEKHRILLAVGSQAAGIHLGRMMAPLLKGTFPAEAIEAVEKMDIFLNPADKGFPLEPGFELYITAPDEQPNPKLIFRFEVVLAEPGVVEGAPVVECVGNMLRSVEGAVATLLPRLA